MDQIAQQIFYGFSNGCIYALVAIGIVLIYRTTEIVNFAQGDMLMLAAFIGLSLSTLFKMPFALWFTLTLFFMAVFGLLLYFGLMRPLVDKPTFTAIIATLSIGALLRNIVSLIPAWSAENQTLVLPWQNQGFNWAGISLDAERLTVIFGTFILAGALTVLFLHSKLGRQMRAASQNQLAARSLGMNLNRLHGLAWVLAGAIAGLAGLLLAPMTFVHPHMGFIALKAFPAAVLGGFGSLPGAVAGGLIIGIVEALSTFYAPAYGDISPYALLLLVLMLRPEGLFGRVGRRRV